MRAAEGVTIIDDRASNRFPTPLEVIGFSFHEHLMLEGTGGTVINNHHVHSIWFLCLQMKHMNFASES